MRQLLVDMDNGMDLRSWHKASIELLTEDFEIAVGEDEELLYADNCVPGDDGKCTRKRVCAGEDQVWLKDADQRKLQLENIDEKFKRRNARIKAEKLHLLLRNQIHLLISKLWMLLLGLMTRSMEKMITQMKMSRCTAGLEDQKLCRICHHLQGKQDLLLHPQRLLPKSQLGQATRILIWTLLRSWSTWRASMVWSRGRWPPCWSTS